MARPGLRGGQRLGPPPAYVAWYKTRQWRERAREQLQREPWCRFHARLRQKVAATIADHVEPHRGNFSAFWSGRLQSLCHSCHSQVKQSMERGRSAPADARGLPTDPNHPWNCEGD